MTVRNAILPQQPPMQHQNALAGRQSQYAAPDWQSRLTVLPPEQEAAFQHWAMLTGAPITNDYDMRGFWLNRGSLRGGGSAIDPNDGLLHYPDTYKTPLHQTFSGESVYSKATARKPKWNEQDQLIGPDGTVLFDDKAGW